MAAYVIFLREGEIVDPAAMEAYKSAKSPPAVNARPLTVYGEIEALEGKAPEGVVMLEFPDVDAAREWYNGPYRERAKLRQQAADYRGFIVAGI